MALGSSSVKFTSPAPLQRGEEVGRYAKRSPNLFQSCSIRWRHAKLTETAAQDFHPSQLHPLQTSTTSQRSTLECAQHVWDSKAPPWMPVNFWQNSPPAAFPLLWGVFPPHLHGFGRSLYFRQASGAAARRKMAWNWHDSISWMEMHFNGMLKLKGL